jgi:RNA exonuclease 4
MSKEKKDTVKDHSTTPTDKTKTSKKKRKRERKQESKDKAEKSEVKSASIVDQIFNPAKHDKSKALTPIVALDCEMVEVDDHSDGLARVSIVNYNGQVLLDTFVRPKGKITNYRSWVSGVYPSSMKDATPYDEGRQKAVDILKDKIIVGHSLKHDFKVLNWEPLSHNVRDLITFNRFQDEVGHHPKSLKKLAAEFLEKNIQTGAHSSVIDARAALG